MSTDPRDSMYRTGPTDAARRQAPSVQILMYHQVSPQPPPNFRKYTLTPVQFGRQMAWLAARGYRTITFDELLGDAMTLPAKPVLITFDDGYEEAIRWALPVLQQHGFGATFYIIAALAGGTSSWLVPLRGLELPLASWARLREVAAAGFAIGSHSLTHPHLTALSTSDCRNELQESRRIIEDRIGLAVTDLAYPFGSHDERVRSVSGEVGYRSACTVKTGLAAQGCDPLALRRVPISGSESFIDFLWRLRTGGRPMTWVRAKLRSTGAGTAC